MMSRTQGLDSCSAAHCLTGLIGRAVKLGNGNTAMGLRCGGQRIWVRGRLFYVDLVPPHYAVLDCEAHERSVSDLSCMST